jgi:hypothetical protein
MALWLKKNNPGLLKDRMTLFKSSARGWDKAIFGVMAVVFIPFPGGGSPKRERSQGHLYRALSPYSPSHVCGRYHSVGLHPTCPGFALGPNSSRTPHSTGRDSHTFLNMRPCLPEPCANRISITALKMSRDYTVM